MLLPRITCLSGSHSKNTFESLLFASRYSQDKKRNCDTAGIALRFLFLLKNQKNTCAISLDVIQFILSPNIDKRKDFQAMKKLFSLLLCAALLLSAMTGALTSCSGVDEKKEAKYTAAVALIANGNYESAYAAFKELGDYKDSEKYLSGFMYFPSVTSYDLYDRSGVMTTTFGSYNLPVRLLSKGTIDGEGEYTKDGWYSYDSKGNWMRQAVLYNDDFLAYDYTYDANGDVIKAEYTEGGAVVAVHLFAYDENRLLIRESYEENGVIYYEYQHTYDADGNLIKSVCEAGGINYVYDFVYNEDGNLINERGESSDGSTYNIDYTYNDDGNMIKNVRSDNGEISATLDFTYDSNKNLIKEEWSYPDETKDVYTQEYDENGNMIKKVNTYADGTVESAEWQYILTYVPIEIPEWTWGQIMGLFFEII